VLEELSKKDKLWRTYAFQICHDRNTADDIVQEMYLRRLENNRGQQLTDYYILCTIKSIYNNLHAKKERIICLEDLKQITETTPETFEPDDIQKKLLEKIEKLPFTKKELLELNYTYSLREIQEKYNINYAYIHRKIKETRKEILGNRFSKYKNKRLKYKKMQAKGFGDTIDAITTGTGIKRLVKWFFGEDCGCEERRKYFNELLPYPAKCLTDEQREQYQQFCNTRNIELIGNGQAKGTLSKDEIKFITKLYAEVFNRKVWSVPCVSCLGTAKQLTAMVYKLDTLFVNDVPVEKEQVKKQNTKTKVIIESNLR